MPLGAVCADQDRNLAALRLERLTGILLKRGFTNSEVRTIKTCAKRVWHWDIEKLTKGESSAEAEFVLLNKLRGPGPWNEPWIWAPKEQDNSAITWDAFTKDVDSERGLFKVIALFLKDVLNDNEKKTIEEHHRSKESETL